MKKDRKIKIGKRIIELEDIRKATEPEPESPQKFEGTIQNGTAIIQPNKQKTEE